MRLAAGGPREACQNAPVERRPRMLLVACAGIALLVAGCGGGGPKYYDAAKSRSCFDNTTGVTVTPPPKEDFVATTALGGAFTVHFRNNLVTLSFGDDRDEAFRLTQAYVRFHSRNIGIRDVLRPVKNVVALWAAHPSDAELATIQDCLK
jgi:hypothetical protein